MKPIAHIIPGGIAWLPEDNIIFHFEEEAYFDLDAGDFDSEIHITSDSPPRDTDGYITLLNGFKLNPDEGIVKDQKGKIVHSEKEIENAGSGNTDEPSGKFVSCIMFATPSLADAVSEATVIVNGEVVGISETKMGEDGIVHRLANVRIDEDLYGADGTQFIEFVVLGGTYEGVEYEYIDSAQYNIGDKLTLLLDKAPKFKDPNLRALEADDVFYEIVGNNHAYVIEPNVSKYDTGQIQTITDAIRSLASERKELEQGNEEQPKIEEQIDPGIE